MQRDLRYGDNSRALIDYFPAPASAPSRGLLVYFHGGYWQELSKAESAFLAPAWHAAGFAHAVVGYALAPAACLPDIVGDCRAALAWLHARADTLGFDAGRIVAAGSSAGAYLAAACADAASGAALRHRAGVRHLRRRAADRHVDQRCARPGRRDRRRDGSVDGRAPVLSRRGRVGRDRDRGVQAPEPGVRGAARDATRPRARQSKFPAATTSTWCSTWPTRRRRCSPPRARCLPVSLR